MSPTRFDTIEKQVKKMSHKNLYNSKYNEMMREYNSNLNKKSIVFTDKPLGLNPQNIRQQLMKGNGNLIGSAQHTEPIASSYMTNYKGLQSRFSSKALVLDNVTSCSTGCVVPDPLTMKATQNRIQSFKRDLKRVQSMKTSIE